MEVTTGFSLPAVPPDTDRKQTASASEAYREAILLELSRGRNAMGIWQDLVDRSRPGKPMVDGSGQPRIGYFAVLAA
jgi:hypothetical protein